MGIAVEGITTAGDSNQWAVEEGNREQLGNLVAAEDRLVKDKLVEDRQLRDKPIEDKPAGDRPRGHIQALVALLA